MRVPGIRELKAVEESWMPRWRFGAGVTGLACQVQKRKVAAE
ncbi:hypothetical protein [Streptosporangium sp. NPDC002607]